MIGWELIFFLYSFSSCSWLLFFSFLSPSISLLPSLHVYWDFVSSLLKSNLLLHHLFPSIIICYSSLFLSLKDDPYTRIVDEITKREIDQSDDYNGEENANDHFHGYMIFFSLSLSHLFSYVFLYLFILILSSFLPWPMRYCEQQILYISQPNNQLLYLIPIPFILITQNDEAKKLTFEEEK